MTKSNFGIFEKSAVFYACAVLFRFALEYSYLGVITKNYAYSGFVFDPNTLKYLESWILFAILLIFVPNRLTKVSDFLVATMFFGLLVPLLSFYSLSDQQRWIVYAVILQFCLILVFRRGRSIRLPNVKEGVSFSLWICGFILLFSIAWYAFSGGLQYFNLDLTKVYEFRRDAAEVIAPGLLGYLNTWAWKVVGPFLLAFALWKRWWALAIGVAFCHLLWFAVGNHKAVLFYPFVIVFVWYWFQRYSSLVFLPLAFSLVIIIATIYYNLSGDLLPASLFVRRVFYVIAGNTFDYYYFFSEYAKVYWSSSHVSLGLIDPVYELGPAKTIGDWRGTGSHVNNSFLSTGYMHAGWFGLCLYGIIGGFLFRVIDSAGRGKLPLWLALSIVVIPSRSLVLSADLPTAIVTHGIGFAALLLWLTNRESGFIGRQNISTRKSGTGKSLPRIDSSCSR